MLWYIRVILLLIGIVFVLGELGQRDRWGRLVQRL